MALLSLKSSSRRAEDKEEIIGLRHTFTFSRLPGCLKLLVLNPPSSLTSNEWTRCKTRIYKKKQGFGGTGAVMINQNLWEAARRDSQNRHRGLPISKQADSGFCLPSSKSGSTKHCREWVSECEARGQRWQQFSQINPRAPLLLTHHVHSCKENEIVAGPDATEPLTPNILPNVPRFVFDGLQAQQLGHFIRGHSLLQIHLVGKDQHRDLFRANVWTGGDRYELKDQTRVENHLYRDNCSTVKHYAKQNPKCRMNTLWNVSYSWDELQQQQT